MIGVILAAGAAIRFNKEPQKIPCKVLNTINETPLIQFSLDNLVELGIEECIIVVGAFGNIIKENILNCYRGMKITYAEQKDNKGIVNAIMSALEMYEEKSSVLLQLADEVFDGLQTKRIKYIIENMQYDFYCGVTFEEDKEIIKSNYSVETDKNMLLVKCSEKPETTECNMKGTGFCIFGSESIMLLKNIYEEKESILFDLCDYMNYLVSCGKKGLVLRIAEKEFNINTGEELCRAKVYFSDRCEK